MRTASDLLKKAKNDFELLKTNPDDAYLFFNFVVTSSHIFDWAGKPQLTQDEKYLHGICEHIANASKHFALNNRKNDSVRSLEKEEYFEDDYIEDGYIMPQIDIVLTDKHGVPDNTRIELIQFGQSLIEMWENRLSKGSMKGLPSDLSKEP